MGQSGVSAKDLVGQIWTGGVWLDSVGFGWTSLDLVGPSYVRAITKVRGRGLAGKRVTVGILRVWLYMSPPFGAVTP